MKKAAAYIGYGSVGGARAVEHLRNTSVELQMAPVRHGITLVARTHADHDGPEDLDDTKGNFDASCRTCSTTSSGGPTRRAQRGRSTQVQQQAA